MRTHIFALSIITLLISAGCSGGGATTPVNPDPLAQVTGIRPSQGLGTDTPGYAGDELSIQALITGEVPTSIVWDFGGGAIPVSLDDPDMPTVELGVPGSYTGRVTVTDSAGNTDSFEFDFTILPESHRIKGIVDASSVGFVTEAVQFAAELDGEGEFFTWEFNSGTDLTTALGPTPLVQLTELGTHEVELTVTFKAGPTVTRTFPFTVVANPWQVIRQEPEQLILDTLTLSDGSVGVLLFRNGAYEDRHLSLLQLPASEITQADHWTSHEFGVAGALAPGSLAEHQGRLGVLYLAAYAPGYLHPSSKRYRHLAVSQDLHPTSSADWTVSQVSPYFELGSVALTGADGPGWNALISNRNDVVWAATSEMVPSTDDWISGPFASYQSSPSLFIAHTGTALICGTSDETRNDIQVGVPGNFPQLLATSPYFLPGVRARFEACNGRIAAIFQDTNDAVGVALTSEAAPLSIDAWTMIATEASASLGGVNAVSLGDNALYLLRGQQQERPDRSFQTLTLFTRPLDVAVPNWSHQKIVVDTWSNPILVPVSDTPVVTWTENSDNDTLVWAQLAGE